MPQLFFITRADPGREENIRGRGFSGMARAILARPEDEAEGGCPLCGRRASRTALEESAWLPADALTRLEAEHPEWRAPDGACPACVQQALLETLLGDGDAALHAAVQVVWPLDARAAFGALPTPLRLHADPRFAGRGTTIAFVDSGFYPHPDLTTPRNRILAWIDAATHEIAEIRFGPEDTPRWPGWGAAEAGQWHGTMTSCSACGNGALSRGLYRGLASEAGVALVQAGDAAGRITGASIARALGWIRGHAEELGIGVVSVSCAADRADAFAGAVDAAVRDLVRDGIVVVAAAGNDGERRLVAPATAPEAITVGGLDDHNTFDDADVALWHSNFGESSHGAPKPEIVAPSLWVVAPVLPGTAAAHDAARLFLARFAGGAGRPRPEVEAELRAGRWVTPHYQHVEGTSFAAPLVASAVACMLEAQPTLEPALVREVLIATAQPVPGAPRERQGAGALDAGRAVARSLAERHRAAASRRTGPRFEDGELVVPLHDHTVSRVEMKGSWDGWGPGVSARPVEPGLWEARLADLSAGMVAYKFVLDGGVWIDDPGNPRKSPDGLGGFNSVVEIV